ncbi:alpha-amylase family member [Holotrichia oblita]|uniref:Alpha-amylase family member n=1 Tax=Holotrichia oblita TaxID=644536 RepID=A0ACB9TQL8_HOLOL|nr:alpha-amylase family member [Holotrichia oblita]
MDKNKLEVSAKDANNSPTANATYKAIPESEYLEEPVSDQALARLNSHAKNHNNAPEADGAHEKMLPEDDKLSHTVKIIPSTGSPEKKADGFTLDIKPSVVVGMGKEELMKYANDPFWVRLRWFLFICFWLLWAAMLIGAILIIIAAPKCAPPEPKTWWEEGPLTEVNALITADELKTLKSRGFKGVIADWPLDSLQTVDDSPDFQSLLKKAKDAGIEIIVGIEPGTSTLHLNDSEAKDDAYVNYYIWRNHAKGNTTESPNNWLTPDDVSAWKYSDVRKQFYYAPFGKPWLNYRDPKVKEEFSRVITKFLDAGARGLRLTRAPYLLVDPDFADENVGDVGNAAVGQYNFYSHHKTKDQPDLGSLLKSWRDIVKNKTEDGLLMLREDLDNLQSYKVNVSLSIDLPRHSQVFNDKLTSGIQIKKAIDSAQQILEGRWALWKSSNTGLDRDVVDIIMFMMPGTSLVPLNHTVNSELLSFRKSPSIMYGSFDTYAVANDSTFAFIRVAPSNPGYIVALNPTEDMVKVNFPQDTKASVQDEVTVQFVSNNYNVTDIEVK